MKNQVQTNNEIVDLERRNRNLVLLEWNLAIWAIFWGFWWGRFMTAILDKKLVFPFSGKEYILLGTTILIGIFVYFYVHQMWNMRDFDANTPFFSVTFRMGRLFLAWLVFSFAVWYLGATYLEQARAAFEIVYGVSLMFLWMISNIFLTTFPDLD